MPIVITPTKRSLPPEFGEGGVAAARRELRYEDVRKETPQEVPWVPRAVGTDTEGMTDSMDEDLDDLDFQDYPPEPELPDLDKGASSAGDDESSSESDSTDSSSPQASDLEADADQEAKPDCLKDLFTKFMLTNIKHRASKAAQASMWKFLDDQYGLLKCAKEEHDEKMPSFKTMSRRLEETLPEICISCAHVRRSTDYVSYDVEVRTFPKKKYRNKRRWALQYEYTRAKVAGIQHLHNLNGTSHSNVVILSVDGVPINRSSGTSMTVVAMRFKGCRCVFPLGIYVPQLHPTVELNLQDIMMPIIDDILDQDLTIAMVIADAPLRCKLRGCLNFNSYYPCDYCYAKATHDGKMYISARQLSSRVDRRHHSHHAYFTNEMEAGRLTDRKSVV